MPVFRPLASNQKSFAHRSGFTLAELLIALSILGVIAAFTIPKVLQSQQDERKRAITKEVMATLSQALQAARLDGTLTNTMTASSLTPYMNYTAVLAAGTTFDERPNYLGPTFTCAASSCIRLHNGAVLTPMNGSTFISNATTCATNGYVDYTLDADGTYTGTADSIRLRLTYEGRAGTRAYTSCAGTGNSADDPSWFSF